MSLLDSNLTEVPLTYPVIKKGPVELRVLAINVAPTKKDETKEMLTVDLETCHEEHGLQLNKKGEWDQIKLPAGHKLTHRITLTPGEKRTEQQVLRDLKKLRIGLTGQEEGAFGDPQAYVGKQAIAEVDVENSDDFGPQNRIKSWLPKGQLPPTK